MCALYSISVDKYNVYILFSLTRSVTCFVADATFVSSRLDLSDVTYSQLIYEFAYAKFTLPIPEL